VEAFSPSVVHTWRWSSLRAILLAAGKKRKIVASALEQPQQPGKLLNWLDQRLLCRVDQVIANDAAGADQLQQSGLVNGRVNVIPPGVAPAGPVNATALAFRHSLGLSADSRLLFCVGPLEPHKGFRDAVWTVDILRYLYDSLHLVLIGGGSDRPRLEQFVQSTGGSDKSHFAGWNADVPALLSLAEVIWLPSQKRGGVNVALEAMAAGRPVVASRLPSLAEVIADGETGLLVPPGNKVEMARQTRLLLDNPERCRLMGAAGQRRAQTHFSVASMVERFARVYEVVSGE
jgi:glycosyltransferase involved in cell wall biosynthesis